MASHLTDEAHGQPYIDENASMTAEKENPGESKDVFVEDEAHQIQYKTLSWQVRLSSSLHAVKS
jgi:FtsZ-binding cell division protein ZapB